MQYQNVFVSYQVGVLV